MGSLLGAGQLLGWTANGALSTVSQVSRTSSEVVVWFSVDKNFKKKLRESQTLDKRVCF